MPKTAEDILAEMPKEQQKQLAQIYSFLTQVPLFKPAQSLSQDVLLWKSGLVTFKKADKMFLG